MLGKFTYSQSTIASGARQFKPYQPKEGQSALKNPFNQTLPLKFPKNRIIRQCPQTMLHQSLQKAPVSSVRNYVQSNRSRYFEGSPQPLSHSELMSRHPKHLFDTYHQRKLSNPGAFEHLSRQSLEYPVRLRTFQDIGTVNNTKRLNDRMHYRPDPIISGVQEKHHNSSLERPWKEFRRYRDNGLQCEKAFNCQPKLKKREPYLTAIKVEKPTSYKDRYMKTRNMK